MTTELVYRMRTCAAALVDGGFDISRTDAADLLIEASNLLDTPEELGEPMKVLELAQANKAVWGTDLPAAIPQRCPSCGSIDARTARRAGRQLMLTCPRCAATWEYGRHGAT
jgi:hypothetical protein